MHYKLQMQTLKVQKRAALEAFNQQKRALKLQHKEQHQLRKAAKRGQASPLSSPLASAAGAPVEPSAPMESELAGGPSPLQQLAEMGFENIELLAQLLEAHGDNVLKVLEVLMGLVAEDWATK